MDRKRASSAIAGWGWLVVGPVLGACAQTAGSNAAAVPATLRAVAAPPETALDPEVQVLREIDDPSTGDLWLLVRDPSRPAGPGRFLLARQRMNTQRTISGGPAQPLSRGERPVIHTGDALMVEEHTAVVDARLEAVALEPAVKGAHFKARLKIGGKVVRVVAVSPGRADFAAESEVEP
jgi:hypothetical protein